MVQNVSTNLAILNNEALVDTRFQHLQHLVVLHIVADVLQYVAVGDDPQCTEDDPDRDVDLDVGNGGLHDIPELWYQVRCVVTVVAYKTCNIPNAPGSYGKA